MNKSVYLAGPISGLSYTEATQWREDAKRVLNSNNITALSPMRFKEYLKEFESLSKMSAAEADIYKNLSVLSSAKGITVRDRNDATRCDALIVNFLGAKNVSIGTVIELGWADANRIPIIVIMEEEGNIHDHGMVNEITGFRVSNVQAAIDIAVAILTQ